MHDPETIKVVLPNDFLIHMDFFHDLVEQGFTWSFYSKKAIDENDVEYTIGIWAISS